MRDASLSIAAACRSRVWGVKSSWERRRRGGIWKKTNHRGTETQRKTKRGQNAREARSFNLLVFVFLCVSVPLWLAS